MKQGWSDPGNALADVSLCLLLFWRVHLFSSSSCIFISFVELSFLRDEVESLREERIVKSDIWHHLVL